MRSPKFITALSLVASVQAIHLTDDRLDKVFDVLQDISRYSWENGTKAQAILEHSYPSLSVFSPTPAFPLPNPLPSGDISMIIDIAQTTLNNREPVNETSARGGLGLVPDAAAADPASLGVAVLLANASTNNAQVAGVGYGEAATAQLNYLLYDVPRVSTAIGSRLGHQLTARPQQVRLATERVKHNYGQTSSTWCVAVIIYSDCSND